MVEETLENVAHIENFGENGKNQRNLSVVSTKSRTRSRSLKDIVFNPFRKTKPIELVKSSLSTVSLDSNKSINDSYHNLQTVTEERSELELLIETRENEIEILRATNSSLSKQLVNNANEKALLREENEHIMKQEHSLEKQNKNLKRTISVLTVVNILVVVTIGIMLKSK